MRSRGLVVVLALLLAAGATAAVFLYVRGVREEARTGGELVRVIVPTQDIPAGTELDPLIQQGAFRELEIPRDAVVVGAVTDLSQLRGQTATSAILAGEQIPTQRLSSGALPGGALGLTEGYQAVTVSLSAEQIVGPALQRGAHVTVYASFPGVDTRSLRGGTAPAPTQVRGIPGLVMPLVQEVRVLDVLRPGVAEGEQAADQGALVTLELLPVDAEKVVFAQQNGRIWLGLIAPEDVGAVEAIRPVDFLQLARRTQ
ncbi:MAG TPA: Flp pilus assembly protein CpaB [Actinomycetota bacterium]|nr:Flp pilus assembly protein CpaB [Actinomycetota bacterium]